jgi:hypothetical protein
MKTVWLLFPLLAVLVAGCTDASVDGEGLADGSCAQTLFTRASQLYFRGRLSAALEDFNGVIYRYPDTNYAADARLAVRRIERDLTGDENGAVSEGPPVVRAAVAVVGSPLASQGVARVSAGFRGLGVSVIEVSDHQAPEITMVFHAQGFLSEASVLAEHLGGWLLRPESVSVRPGDELIEAVAPGAEIMIIIGSDAVFLPEQQGEGL